MGKHSAKQTLRGSLRGKKKRLIRIVTVMAALILLVGSGVLLAETANPYKAVLRRAGVETETCKLRKGVLYLTFEGDAEGILSCRNALNALRADTPPDTVEWSLVQDGEERLSGTVTQVGYIPPSNSPRVETLGEDLTLLKLKYELEQSGLSVTVERAETVGVPGKTVTVTVDASVDGWKSAETAVPAAVSAVNEEGGGIVRYDLIFRQDDTVIAAASYDLIYGDALRSSRLEEN